MPTTGLFFLPASNSESSPAQDIIYRLSTTYEATPLPSWTLSHRLFRETPGGKGPQFLNGPDSGVEKSKVPTQRYLQVLSLSHRGPATFIAVTVASSGSQAKTGPPVSSNLGPDNSGRDQATITSIPSGSSTEEFLQMITSKFGPLWQQRQVLYVNNGLAFETGDFRVRVGEVKQGYGGGAQIARGGICEIELLNRGRPDDDSDAEMEEALIRGCWEGFGVKSARESIRASKSLDSDMTVRQWYEMLRLRT